jgi:hypothetical protein
LALTPQFLLALAVRYRYLAAKARREANAVSGDPIAPRLIELAEKLAGDAVRDVEEARILLAEQDGATPLRQHDRDAGPKLGKATTNCWRRTIVKSSAAMRCPTPGNHAQHN